MIIGDQPIHIHADKKEWQKITERNIDLFGSLNQHVVPSAPNPLFEFWDPGRRWNGMPGNVWQKANPPITLGEDMRSPNKISYRWCASQFFLGKPQGLKIQVRNNGCYSCPLRCYSIVEDEEAAARYHINKMTEQTCMSLYFGRVIFPKIATKRDLPAARQASMVGIQTMDDLGVWCNYGQLHRDFKKMYVKGLWKKVLPEKEYNSIRRTAKRILSGDPLKDGRPFSDLIELDEHSRKCLEFEATLTDQQIEMLQDLGYLPVTTRQYAEECEECPYTLDEREHGICRRCLIFKK